MIYWLLFWKNITLSDFFLDCMCDCFLFIYCLVFSKSCSFVFSISRMSIKFGDKSIEIARYINDELLSNRTYGSMPATLGIAVDEELEDTVYCHTHSCLCDHCVTTGGHVAMPVYTRANANDLTVQRVLQSMCEKSVRSVDPMMTVSHIARFFVRWVFDGRLAAVENLNVFFSARCLFAGQHRRRCRTRNRSSHPKT